MFLVYFNVFLRFACHFRNIIVQRLRATCRISALYKCMNYYYYYCRDKQSIWLGGHFQKAAFSGWIDRFFCMYSSRQRMPWNWKNRGYPDKCPSGVLSAGRTF